MTEDSDDWGKKIAVKDGSLSDRCPHTIHCANEDGRIDEDNPECELREVRTREIDATHEWITEECQRDECDGRKWFRRRCSTTLGEFGL